MMNEIIEFCAEDGVVLNGYINKGKVKTDKVLIELHGMTSNCFKRREKVIAKYVENIDIDSLCFNNRGSDIVKYIKYKDDKKKLAGTAYEDIEESYYDVIGAIKCVIQLGYKKIFLQGHSLGATKLVYTFNKMKKNNSVYLKYINGIILLSLVDIPYIFNKFTNHKYHEYAMRKEKENSTLELMPQDCFIHPISVKKFLKYTKYNKEIDFAKFSEDNYRFEELNSINVPIFMRWGNNKELIEKDAKEQVEFMNKKIDNIFKDINYIDCANHTFSDKEEILANQICEFLQKIYKINIF